MQQTEKYWNLINRIVLMAAVAMAAVGAVLAFAPKVKQMQTYQNTRDTLQQRIDVTVAAERELKEKQQRFLTDPAYVERVAHEVGYARRNEAIFHFPEETGAP
ncbi:MAG: septum formation initiator family protein [Verrucomicrobiota bacterium]